MHKQFNGCPFIHVVMVFYMQFTVLKLKFQHSCFGFMGGWWRWALVGPDRVVPSQIVGMSASVNLPLHHKVQKFSSGTSSPGWSGKKGRKMVIVVLWPCIDIKENVTFTITNQRLTCYDYALYKSTFYLLTYLLN